MKKTTILQILLTKLEDDLRRLRLANEEASAGATHSETRAETKWDTCGLESSYLARGHAQQFEALARDVHDLRAFVPTSFKDLPIDVGALIKVEQGGEVSLFFLLSCGGGVELIVEEREITIITPASPVGAALVGKKKGESYSFRKGLSGNILNVS